VLYLYPGVSLTTIDQELLAYDRRYAIEIYSLLHVHGYSSSTTVELYWLVFEPTEVTATRLLELGKYYSFMTAVYF
jgi:hypothetical protein